MDVVRIGVERLVRNIAAAGCMSLDAAIFRVECVLQDLKRRPPKPPEPPTIRMAA